MAETDAKAARIKGYATLVASVTGLVVALGAWSKPRDDRATEQGYDAISGSLREIGVDVQRQHEDLVQLHAYLEAHVAGTLPAQACLADAGADAGPGSPKPLPVPAPPRIALRPRPVAPPSFAAVKGRADAL